jgi:N-acyl-phosphatidylethanolamine-hydrolysing phospholipase D
LLTETSRSRSRTAPSRPLTVVCAALVALAGLVVASAPPSFSAEPAPPPHHLLRGFRNLDTGYEYSLHTRTLRFVRQSLHGSPSRGRTFPLIANDGAALRDNGTMPTLTWIGHATFLIQVDGVNVLTDPHWGDRASPVSFAGPRRLVPPGLRFADLPPIHAVVISHDHYDHLDADTVTRLARAHNPRFFVPLGLKTWMRQHGVDDVVELDWWQESRWRGVTFVSAPAQHSSGRGLRDQNLRLWSSWVVAGARRRAFFAGDTGYFAGAREIGERLGPFDVALVPIGGYSAWEGHHPNHVSPEEAVQLFEDVDARRLAPMHWGTFALNREPFREPPDRLLAEALRRGIEERVALLAPGESIHW